MIEPRLGRIARALRHRLRWRQVDVSTKARVGQGAVSRLERGQVDGMTVGTLRRLIGALDGDLVLLVRWRGGELDRLLDEGHAAIVGRVASFLELRGWETRVEVSFAVYGERGSVDLLAWHAATSTLLVVEVKTEIVSVEETIRRHDIKWRLAPGLARTRFGWRPRHVARLLALPDTTTARRRIARHAPVFSRAYPLRGGDLRSWLRAPGSDAAGILFTPPSDGVTGVLPHAGRKRVMAARFRTKRGQASARDPADGPHQSPGS